MMLFDTNIISEMMKPHPSVKVMDWVDQQEVSNLFVSTISIAEICYGINVLPVGNRRDLLEEAFNQAIAESFQQRVLLFDDAAAHLYGKIMGLRKKLGRPLSILDGQIAAVARSNGAALVTRNAKDFSDCGFNLINPFET